MKDVMVSIGITNNNEKYGLFSYMSDRTILSIMAYFVMRKGLGKPADMLPAFSGICYCLRGDLESIEFCVVNQT